ncbi:2-dehydro-3-deoxyphosphooctonate aldolase [Marinomonas sp. MED121]|nr:2-dehydro-3-deoxyphosphooctonate aldolase [Marinomonas sp. MED121]
MSDDVLDVPILEKSELYVATVNAQSLALDCADWVSSWMRGEEL